VLDSGCGLADDVRERIFESFYTTKKSGMGMGLTISKGIIKRHRGELGAENRAEGGSRFWFTLPLGYNSGCLCQARLSDVGYDLY